MNKHPLIVLIFLAVVPVSCVSTAAETSEYSAYTIAEGSQVGFSANAETIKLAQGSSIKMRMNLRDKAQTPLWQRADLSITGGPFLIDYDRGGLWSTAINSDFNSIVDGKITWSVGKKTVVLTADSASVKTFGELRLPLVSFKGSCFAEPGRTIDACLKYVNKQTAARVKADIIESENKSKAKQRDLNNGLKLFTTEGLDDGRIDVVLLFLAPSRVFCIPLLPADTPVSQADKVINQTQSRAAVGASARLPQQGASEIKDSKHEEERNNPPDGECQETTECWKALSISIVVRGLRQATVVDFRHLPDLPADSSEAVQSIIDSTDWKQAVKVYEQILKEGHRCARLYNNLANAYLSSGEKRAAIESLTNGLEMGEDIATLHLNRGNLYYLFDLKDLAIRDYSLALERNPRLELAAFALNAVEEGGSRHNMLGIRFEDPATVRRFRPSCATGWLNIGSAYQRNGFAGLAILAYKEALSMAPTYFDALLCLGSAYIRHGNTELANKYYNKALSVRSGSRSTILRDVGKTYIAMDKGDIGLRFLKDAWDANDQSLATAWELGQYYKSILDLDKAQHWLGEANFLAMRHAQPEARILIRAELEELRQMQGE